MCKLNEKDLQILKLLSHKDTVRVAIDLGYSSPNPLYQRLHRIRNKRIQAQSVVNRINSLEQRNPRLRKFLNSGKVKDLDKGLEEP